MNCNDIEPLIYLMRDGELTDSEKNLVSQHIGVCPGCYELVRSLKVMAEKVSKADYNEGIFIQDESLLPPLLNKTGNPVRSFSFSFLKALAACVLLILVSAFVFQEYRFNRERTLLHMKLQQSEYLNSADPGISECVQEIKRKIHSNSLTSFVRRDTMQVNLISEEALTRYVKDRCGYNDSDIKAVKKMLIQAGLIN